CKLRFVEELAADYLLGSSWFREQNLCYEQQSTYDDRTVGDIEGRPLILLHVEEKKVDNMSVKHAVPQVADCAAENERETDSSAGEHVAIAPQQDRNHSQCDEREDH